VCGVAILDGAPSSPPSWGAFVVDVKLCVRYERARDEAAHPKGLKHVRVGAEDLSSSEEYMEPCETSQPTPEGEVSCPAPLGAQKQAAQAQTHQHTQAVALPLQQAPQAARVLHQSRVLYICRRVG
jgi:hypothetical protein